MGMTEKNDGRSAVEIFPKENLLWLMEIKTKFAVKALDYKLLFLIFQWYLQGLSKRGLPKHSTRQVVFSLAIEKSKC